MRTGTYNRHISFQYIDKLRQLVHTSLSIRCEPLESLENRIIKRAFDVVCSGLFLITVFPFVYIFFGIAIKLSSPGPVFFKQKRSGEDGREFWCYKFRSMKVNAQCDTLQATENDPRKTPEFTAILTTAFLFEKNRTGRDNEKD